MADLSLDLCGVHFKNPVIAASGTFGFGREYDELYDISALGGISVKGLCLGGRMGNPPSRLTETPGGMLNCVGLQNPGIESFIEHDLPWLLEKDVNVIANFFGTSIDSYCAAAEAFAYTGVHMLEMNISCPNVHDGGVAFGVKPESVYEITKAMFDNQADLAKAQAKFGFLSPEGAVAGSFDLHPGAEKYYKEIGVL